MVVLAQALRKDIVQQRPLACVDAGAFHAAGAVQNEHDSFLPSCPSTILLIDTPRPSVEGVIIRLNVFADVLRPLVVIGRKVLIVQRRQGALTRMVVLQALSDEHAAQADHDLHDQPRAHESKVEKAITACRELSV